MGYMTMRQAILLLVFNFISATVSIAGSSTIIYSVLQQLRLPQDTGRSRRSLRQNKHVCTENRTYLRLLLGMSCFDIIASLNMMVQPFMVDVASNYPFAYGNRSTCTIAGCFQQISFGGFNYYGMLSFYYLFSVRFGCTRGWIARRAEPVMHTFAIAWPVVTAVTGVFMDWYSYTDLALACWVANYPKGCQFDKSIECRSPIVGWAIAGGVYIFLVVSLAVNNTMVYMHVKRVYSATSKRTRKNDQHETGLCSRLKRLFSKDSNQEGTASFYDNSRTSGSHRSSYPGQQSLQTVDSREIFSQNLSGGEAQRRRIRQVATQATLYVAAALVTYLPMVIAGSLLVELGYSSNNQSDVFGVILVQTILMPLAGFWNAVIYFRPQYLAARRQCAQSNSSSNLPGFWVVLRQWSGRPVGGECSSRGSFPSSSRWGLRSPSKDDNAQKEAVKVEESRETPISPTQSPTRRASSFLALDTNYMNEPCISSVTAAMLEAAKMIESDEGDERSLLSNLEEKEDSESDLDEESLAMRGIVGLSHYDVSEAAATPEAGETKRLEIDRVIAAANDSMPVEGHSDDIEYAKNRRDEEH